MATTTYAMDKVPTGSGNSSKSQHSAGQTATSPSSHNRSVNFNTQREAMKEQKKKYLTAKYGQHQMSLIRKRLKVEDWLDERLRFLYGCKDDSEEYDSKLDLEELLNLETDTERRCYAMSMLKNAKQPPAVVEEFVVQLLKQAGTL
ncbi:protein phosphatase 1 regulatory subunit 14B-like [Argonauta hians]